MTKQITKVINFTGYDQEYLIDGVKSVNIDKKLQESMRKIYHKFRGEPELSASTRLHARAITMRLIAWVPTLEHTHVIVPSDLPDFCEKALVHELNKIGQYTPIKLVTEWDEYLAKWEPLNVNQDNNHVVT